LAQLEESCRPENGGNNNNNIARARLVYQTAADTYERSRNIYHKQSNNPNSTTAKLKLHNLHRASELLELALSLSDDSEEKSQFLSTKATVECMRQNYRLAKHCVT
jgi:hypothetical protein